MREAIIKSSIEGLQREGLRFSIDEVAKSLKISKKTIYKYFATKEGLAVEIYKTFYKNAIQRISDIENTASQDGIVKIIGIYYESHCMVRGDIFNKYALNENIRILAHINHNKIKAYIEKLLPKEDSIALMIIIDGALQNLCENKVEEEKVIKRLVMLICR